MQLKPDKHTRDIKDIVFDLLKDKVDTFTVRFDGSGDSGQMEEIELDDKIYKMPVDGIKLRNGTRYCKGVSEQIWKDANTLGDVIESICYDTLEKACAGWEINDGSYGEFVFDVKKRTVVLDFNQRITDVRSSTYEF